MSKKKAVSSQQEVRSTPETFADLLGETEKVQQEEKQRTARWLLTYWLKRSWLKDQRPKELQDDRLLRWYDKIELDQPDIQVFEKSIRERQTTFFKDILPNDQWLQIAEGKRPAEARDYQALVKQHLDTPDVSTNLAIPELVLFDRQGLITLHLLYGTAEGYEEGSYALAARDLYEQDRKTLRKATAPKRTLR